MVWSMGHKELDMTQRLNNNNNLKFKSILITLQPPPTHIFIYYLTSYFTSFCFICSLTTYLDIQTFTPLVFYFPWLHWVFVAAHGLSLVVESRGYSSFQYEGFSLLWLLLLQSMCSRAWWLQQLLAHRFSCPEMRYFPRPRIHSMSLHWWADSQPLDQQGSLSFSLCNLPVSFFKKYKFIYFNWGLITLQYCIGFAIHQHESATGVPVSFINC